jgi:uncharacterized protein (DUF3084 family)
MSAHGPLCILALSVFAALIGWFARQLVAERDTTARDLRGELDAARARIDAEAGRVEFFSGALDQALASVAESTQQVSAMEAEIAQHERHVRELAQEIVERDRKLRRLEAALQTALAESASHAASVEEGAEGEESAVHERPLGREAMIVVMQTALAESAFKKR